MESHPIVVRHRAMVQHVRRIVRDDLNQLTKVHHRFVVRTQEDVERLQKIVSEIVKKEDEGTPKENPSSIIE